MTIAKICRSQLSSLIVELELSGFDLLQNMITEQDKIVWQSIGLPPDVQSMENAAILAKVYIFALVNEIVTIS